MQKHLEATNRLVELLGTNQAPVRVSAVSETLETVRNSSSPEMLLAVRWLQDNPDLRGLSLRQAAREVGVSYSTLNRAKARLVQ